MFFLLASFMMVSLSQTHMKGIRVNLPSGSPPPEPKPRKITLRFKVTEGNVVYFDNVTLCRTTRFCRAFTSSTRRTRTSKFRSAPMLALHGDVIASPRQSAQGRNHESRVSDQTAGRAGCAQAGCASCAPAASTTVTDSR